MSQETNTTNASAATTAHKEMYRAGTQTGSLMNQLMGGAKDKAPKVGMGCTILGWTDRHAATISEVSVSGKRIGIIEDIATRTDSNGMSDCQSYEYAPGNGGAQYFTLRKNGAWVREGDSMKGTRLLIGVRDEHYDYSF